MAVFWVIVIALVAIVEGASISPEKQERVPCGRVWVTVHSPEIRSGSINVLDAVELNWDFIACPTVPRLIGLFNQLPVTFNNALVTFPISTREGHITTLFSLGEGNLPGGWQNGQGIRGAHCLWPWAGAGDGLISFSNCLKIQPTWMEDYGVSINRLRIGELAIPGTHNAGAWRFNTEISNLARDSFVLCQDRSIWAQLVHGIRYFDFRIAYYDFYANEDDRYWLNHNFIRVRPLVPLLREIRAFLDSTREVVFLDAHGFPVGFYDNGVPIQHVHAGFLRIIQRELGPHLALHTQFGTGFGTRGPTVQTLVNANRRLLFSYIDNSIQAQNNWLWPRIPHLWANTNRVPDLFNFLDREIAQSPRPNERNPLFAAMAQTTPTALDIITLRGSIRQSADDVTRIVTRRMKTQWRQRANIVALDFFLGNDVVDVSIILNLER